MADPTACGEPSLGVIQTVDSIHWPDTWSRRVDTPTETSVPSVPCTTDSPLAVSAWRHADHTDSRSAYLLLKNGLALSFSAPPMTACALHSAAANSLIDSLLIISYFLLVSKKYKHFGQIECFCCTPVSFEASRRQSILYGYARLQRWNIWWQPTA